MAPRQPPRLVVRTLDDAVRERRRRRLLVGAWALSLMIAAGLGTWATRRPSGPTAPDHADTRRLLADNEALRQRAAILEGAAQVGDVATRELKRNLAERDEEISGLRADLAFYARLVGGNGQREGLRIQGVRSTPVKDSPQAWNLTVTLTQNARRGEVIRGTLQLSVEGIQGNAVATLDGAALGLAGDHQALPFSFKYFQQVQGSFTLPRGFQPTRMRLAATAADGTRVDATVPWADATRNEEIDDVQR
ncbi:hypothetical protein P3W24_14895 [Luteibacter sp. PPL201]|uniref:Uncharacterized protein n=1 Tax=Luteibacter sahnii TaxID=3021977 RepID=A0ABT6BE19_9GAMM